MQKEVIEQGITKNVDIEEYKQKNLEPGAVEIRVSYRLLGIDEYDRSTVSRKALVKFLRGRYGSTSYEISQGEIRISCSDKNISISERSITWERYVTLLDQYCPKEEKEEPDRLPRGGGRDGCVRRGGRRAGDCRAAAHARQSLFVAEAGSGDHLCRFDG